MKRAVPGEKLPIYRAEKIPISLRMRKLIRVFAVRWQNNWLLRNISMNGESTNQAARMPVRMLI